MGHYAGLVAISGVGVVGVGMCKVVIHVVDYGRGLRLGCDGDGLYSHRGAWLLSVRAF